MFSQIKAHAQAKKKLAVKRPIIYMADWESYSISCRLKILAYYYQLSLFNCLLTAVGFEVVEIPEPKEQDKYLSSFLRDHVTLLHDKSIVLYTEKNLENGAGVLINTFRQFTPCKVDDAYFEGGNVFYLPKHHLLFHGNNPVGFYEKEITGQKPRSNKVRPYLIEPEKTNEHLQSTLSAYDIRVIGLSLDSMILDYNDGSLHCDWYYHLDCFMQTLPDGRVVILNKKILSLPSQKTLEQALGEHFIDLAYEDYLSCPCLLNFIVADLDAVTIIVAPSLPKVIYERLTALSLKVIIPHVLNVDSPIYDVDLTIKVALELQKKGFYRTTEKNIFSQIAINKNYYTDKGLMNFNDLSPEQKNLVFIEFRALFQELDFIHGHGGPHCLTMSITPDCCKSEVVDEPSQKAKKIPLSSFFKAPAKSSVDHSCEQSMGLN